MFLFQGQFRRLAVLFLMLVSLAAVVPGVASAQGNSHAARLCQKDGWQNLQGVQQGVDGVTYFASQGECVKFAAQGRVLQQKATPLPAVEWSYATSEFSGLCTVSFTVSNLDPSQTYYYRTALGDETEHDFTAFQPNASGSFTGPDWYANEYDSLVLDIVTDPAHPDTSLILRSTSEPSCAAGSGT